MIETETLILNLVIGKRERRRERRTRKVFVLYTNGGSLCNLKFEGDIVYV
jgi:hypothetical protein